MPRSSYPIRPLLFLGAFLVLVGGIVLLQVTLDVKFPAILVEDDCKDPERGCNGNDLPPDFCYQGDEQGNVTGPVSTPTSGGSFCNFDSNPQCDANNAGGAGAANGGCPGGTTPQDTGGYCEAWCDQNPMSGGNPPASGDDVYQCWGTTVNCVPDPVSSAPASSSGPASSAGASASTGGGSSGGASSAASAASSAGGSAASVVSSTAVSASAGSQGSSSSITFSLSSSSIPPPPPPFVIVSCQNPNAICTASWGGSIPQPWGWPILNGSNYSSYPYATCPLGTIPNPLYQQIGGYILPTFCGVANHTGTCVECIPLGGTSGGGGSSASSSSSSPGGTSGGGGSSSAGPTCQQAAKCSNGLDDDGDGVKDELDPGCWLNPTDPNSYISTLNHEERATTRCQDGVDNDADTLFDFFDPGCWTNPNDSNTYNPKRNNERAATTTCQDGIDNDGDGLVDHQDPACYLESYAETGGDPECNNGYDDDGDNLTDAQDPGCVNAIDTVETQTSGSPQCSDGVDNDGDGYIDMGSSGGYGTDPGCLVGSSETDSSPHGVLDSDAPTCREIRGWSCDPNAWSAAVQIRVYAGGPMNGGGTLIGSSFSANVPHEQRVSMLCNNTQNHRFSWNVPAQYQEQPQTLYVYAMNQGAGTNTLLGTVDPNCNLIVPECSDGMDNDGDGAIDYGAGGVTQHTFTHLPTNTYPASVGTFPVVPGTMLKVYNITGTFSYWTPGLDLQCDQIYQNWDPSNQYTPPGVGNFLVTFETSGGSAISSVVLPDLQTPVQVPANAAQVRIKFPDSLPSDNRGSCSFTMMNYPTTDNGCTTATDDDEYDACFTADPPLICAAYPPLITFSNYPDGTHIHQQFESQGLKLQATCMTGLTGTDFRTNGDCMQVYGLGGDQMMLVPPGTVNPISMVMMSFYDPISQEPAEMGDVHFELQLVEGSEHTMVQGFGTDYSIVLVIDNGNVEQTVTTAGVPSTTTYPYTGNTVPVNLGGPIQFLTIHSST